MEPGIEPGLRVDSEIIEQWWSHLSEGDREILRDESHGGDPAACFNLYWSRGQAITESDLNRLSDGYCPRCGYRGFVLGPRPDGGASITCNIECGRYTCRARYRVLFDYFALAVVGFTLSPGHLSESWLSVPRMPWWVLIKELVTGHLLFVMLMKQTASPEVSRGTAAFARSGRPKPESASTITSAASGKAAVAAVTRDVRMSALAGPQQLQRHCVAVKGHFEAKPVHLDATAGATHDPEAFYELAHRLRVPARVGDGLLERHHFVRQEQERQIVRRALLEIIRRRLPGWAHRRTPEPKLSQFVCFG